MLLLDKHAVGTAKGVKAVMAMSCIGTAEGEMWRDR